MIGDMKFEEVSLTDYLVKNLEPLTQADPVILAKYVVALLKKDKPLEELQKLCTDNLLEFLGNGTESFTAKLFQAIEDGLFVKVDRTGGVTQKLESSQAPSTEGIDPLKNPSPNKDNDSSSSSEPPSDPEDREGSDDDRNHKHRKREDRPDSFETDSQQHLVKRPKKKHNKTYDNGQVITDSDLHSSDLNKDNPTSGRNASSKFDRRHCDMALHQRTRFSQPFRNDAGSRFDLSTSVGRHIGRGRGRSTVPWNDSRFNPHDALDFSSQMAPQGSGHPGLFVGTGLPNAASTQNSSWGGFGFIPGMSNGIMDSLNPLGLQGALLPSITPPLNFGMSRQRCRDFEELGFCLRGDMCPMEHGLNRIVVEDVQSLSQFNLPVSVQSSHALGIQDGPGSMPPLPATSGQIANTKSMSKSSKLGAVDVMKLNDIPSTSGGDDADVYDPDQPLWNNDHPDASAALLRLSSSNTKDEPSRDGDSSVRQSFRSDGIESEVPNRRGTNTTNSSVWGRIGSGKMSTAGSRIGNVTTAGSLGKEMKETCEESTDNIHASDQGKGDANMEIGSKATNIPPFNRSHTESGHKSGREFQKASRTIFVRGVPQKSNRRNELISHFQKFGEIIDLYVPKNGEKAFVQFSKREEAETALRSSDAVMGNRFIKLSWAYRDRILDDGQTSGHNTSVQSSAVTTSLLAQQPLASGGKETPPISSQRKSIIPAADTPIPSAGPVKDLMSNAPKPAPPVQNKLESLELLEELRRKQESLAKKRDDFRRQLEKLEKQAISKKGEVVSEQVTRRHKVDVVTEADKAAIPKNLVRVTDKSLEKSNCDSVLNSNMLKAKSLTSQHSLKNASHTSPLLASSPNRFKLDNRPTSFKVLPPLPAAFASVAAIKDHFSLYGAVLSVVLEDPEHAENECLTPAENCSACITFANRHFAERAYQSGKCWEGHNLQFKWLKVSSTSSSDYSTDTSMGSSPKVAQTVDIQLNPMTSGSAPPSAEM